MAIDNGPGWKCIDDGPEYKLVLDGEGPGWKCDSGPRWGPPENDSLLLGPPEGDSILH